MRVIRARNPHAALPLALELLDTEGISRDSRNGPVVVSPEPVSTVYSHPRERVVWWAQRDYNVAFVLYEALWMLAGRNDLAPLTRYIRDFGRYSDDGKTLHGAYGHRWRYWPVTCESNPLTFDQLPHIIHRLKSDYSDRRAVLQMWDPKRDLGIDGRDVPCNLDATFQVDHDGRLNLVVFCRSNDTIWGAYFANAFHFSLLLEYVAYKVGCPVGTYTQVSVNFHAYRSALDQVRFIPRGPTSFISDPYATGGGLCDPPVLEGDLDTIVGQLLAEADTGHFVIQHRETWARAAQAVLAAHHCYKNVEGEERFQRAKARLDGVRSCDWTVAMGQWLAKRRSNLKKVGARPEREA